jgi:hypothetical protein
VAGEQTMAKRAKKITIELRPIRSKLTRALNQAKRSIARGDQAIRRATREGRRDDVKRNRQRQAKAKTALAKLKQANTLMNDACCNQRFNCDPDYV